MVFSFVFPKARDSASTFHTNVVIVLNLLLLVHEIDLGVATIEFVTFSCDTVNTTTTQGNFFAAIALRPSGTCRYPTPDADPLTCFVSPEEVKMYLDSLPQGRRAISLEGSSLYSVENASGATIFLDVFKDGTPSPWMEQWASVVEKRFSAWFAHFKAIGGTVDIVLSDLEMGGQAYWYTFASNSPAFINNVKADPRWPSLQAQLNTVGKQYNASFDDISDMHTWVGSALNFTDWRPYVWDMVIVNQGVAMHLNTSVFDPIRANYPSVAFSNFAHHHYTDQSGVNTPTSVDEWWPWASDSGVASAGLGSHAGTHQSTSFYGGSPWQNYSTILVSQSARTEWTTTATPFNALVQGAKRARDMYRGAPDVPTHPWFAPRDFVCADPGMPHGAGSHLFGSNFWQETVFHVALSTAATTFLWWKPGAQIPVNIGAQLMGDTMDELGRVLNDDDDDVECGDIVPIVVDITSLPRWDVPYVLSGVRVTCTNTTATAPAPVPTTTTASTTATAASTATSSTTNTR
eukprot:m.138273 g.138273  ORF g.138273 m.138273 type:complete len:518 (+) comp29982_c2_seq1:132-1685(+)